MAKKHAAPIVIPPADTIDVSAKPTLAYRFIRTCLLKPALHMLFSVKVEGRENFKLIDGGFVAVANHQNWLDAILLPVVLPTKPRPHIMGDPTAFIRLGRVAWWTVRKTGGLICVDRRNHGDPILRRVANTCLQIGGVLSLFPEGRFVRLPGEPIDGLLPLKKSFAHFAHDAGVPVIPITINGVRTLWLRKRITIIVGMPIASVATSIDTIVETTRVALERELRPQPPATGRQLFKRQLTRERPPSERTLATLAPTAPDLGAT